jgi:ADP-ribose pyrophosphatase YjhB (NUDIX family)
MNTAERIDYFDDPAAPKANSLVPSANVIVVNDQGQILIIRRTDNGNWAIPGGAMEPRRVDHRCSRAGDS